MKDTSWKVVLGFTLGWFLCTLYGMGNANAGEYISIDGNTITIVGSLTDDQREAERQARVLTGNIVADAYLAEVERRHEREIEIQKFSNALMLQYAQASKTVVSVGQSVQIQQQVKQRIEQSA